MVDRLVSVNDSLQLPSAVRAALAADLEDDMQEYVTEAQTASSNAILAASAASGSAMTAVAAAEEATAPTDEMVANLVENPASDTYESLGLFVDSEISDNAVRVVRYFMGEWPERDLDWPPGTVWMSQWTDAAGPPDDGGQGDFWFAHDGIFILVTDDWVPYNLHDTGWVTITSFGSDWSAITSAVRRPLAIRRVGTTVFLEGGVSKSGSTSSGEVMFNLPSGFIPAEYRVELTARVGTELTPVTARPDGTVTIQASASSPSMLLTGNQWFVD